MKYFGIVMIVIGALIMVLSYVADSFLGWGTTDNNLVQVFAMLAIIAGVPVHIHVTGKSSKA